MIVIIGGTTVECDENNKYYSMNSFVRYLNGLADQFGEVHFFAIANKSQISNLTLITNEKILITPFFLPKNQILRLISWLPFVLKMFLKSFGSKAVIESFPSSGGIFSEFIIKLLTKSFIVYYKNDPELVWIPKNRKNKLQFIKSLYVISSSKIINNLANIILVRDANQYNNLLKKYPSKTFQSIAKSNFWNVKNFPRIYKMNNKVQILFIGKLVISKGIIDLLECLEILSKDPELKEKEIILEIIGGNTLNHDNPYGDDIKIDKIIEEYFIKNNLFTISFNGYIDNMELLATFYEKCDILVLPSHYEGFPRVLDEASIFGLPIVCTNLPGINKVMSNNVHALMVPPKNPGKLAQAIKKLILDPDLYVSISKNLQKLASKRTTETPVDQHSRLIKEYLRKRYS